MINYEIQCKILEQKNMFVVIIYNNFARNENSLHKIKQMMYFIFTQFPIFTFCAHRISLKKVNQRGNILPK
jgi:hypothetical protein